MFIRLSFFLFVYMSAYLPELFTFVCLAVFVSRRIDAVDTALPVCLFICLSAVSVCQSAFLSIQLSFYFPYLPLPFSYVCLFICLCTCHLQINLFIWLSACVSCSVFLCTGLFLSYYFVFFIVCWRVSPYFRFSVVKTPFWPCGTPGKDWQGLSMDTSRGHFQCNLHDNTFSFSVSQSDLLDLQSLSEKGKLITVHSQIFCQQGDFNKLSLPSILCPVSHLRNIRCQCVTF